jgi:hypothetical protein
MYAGVFAVGLLGGGVVTGLDTVERSYNIVVYSLVLALVISFALFEHDTDTFDDNVVSLSLSSSSAWARKKKMLSSSVMKSVVTYHFLSFRRSVEGSMLTDTPQNVLLCGSVKQ